MDTLHLKFIWAGQNIGAIDQEAGLVDAIGSASNVRKDLHLSKALSCKHCLQDNFYGL